MGHMSRERSAPRTTRGASWASRPASGCGPCGSSIRAAAGLLSWYVCGLDWILAQRDPNDSSRPLIEAVNMSVAKTGSDDADCGNTNRDILHQAICRLYRAGITVVAAAANASRSAAGFVPAAYNEAITVSALADTDGRPGGGGGNKCYSWGTYDRDDTFADFSN